MITELKTTLGEWLAVRVPEGAYNISPSNPKLTNANYIMFDIHHYGRSVSKSKTGKHTIDIPPGEWEIVGKAFDLSDLQWLPIVEVMKSGGFIDCYKDYLKEGYMYGRASQSGHSLLNANGIYKENPYKHPIYLGTMSDDLYKELESKCEEAQQKVYNPLILKRK